MRFSPIDVVVNSSKNNTNKYLMSGAKECNQNQADKQ
jgi:hypothetical protein